MTTAKTTRRTLVAASAIILLAGCMNHPPPPRHPGPYKQPVDAFNAVEAPDDSSGLPNGSNRALSDDLAHLRRAREAYQHSQIEQAARLRDQQARCRQKPNAKLVRIQDDTGDPDAVYCQSSPDTRPQGPGGGGASPSQ